jgi:hypothetical protein
VRAELVLVRLPRDDARRSPRKDGFEVAAVERGCDGVARELKFRVRVALKDGVRGAATGELRRERGETGAEVGCAADGDEETQEGVDDEEFDSRDGTADRGYLRLREPR